MRLKLYIDEVVRAIDVPDDLVSAAEDFFARMDRDMNKGWQMSRYYVECPSTLQRCQIAADRLVSALHVSDRKTLTLMAGYILSRAPGVIAVYIDTNGEMFNTKLIANDGGLMEDDTDQ